MGIAADRQAVFRFLSSFKNQGRRAGVAGAHEGQRRGALPSQRSFSAEDLGALLCRCLVTWCLARTLNLVAPSGHSRASDQDVGLAWSQLQRKILVSLLVNERFWGARSSSGCRRRAWRPCCPGARRRRTPATCGGGRSTTTPRRAPRSPPGDPGPSGGSTIG